MSFKVIVDDVSDSIKGAILAMDAPVKNACTAAIKVAGQRVLLYGQADISRAIHGAKFSAAWHVKFFPPGNQGSIDAAAWAYHKIPFAEIFEDGGTISGRPYLWIPLSNAPLTAGRGRFSVKRAIQQGIKLFKIERTGKDPLLATNIFQSKATANRLSKLHFSLKSLKAGQRPSLRAKSPQARVTVPLFFGIQSVTIEKKLHLQAIADAERDALPDYYVANLEVD